MVVKVGTSTLTGGSRRLSQAVMVDLVRQISLVKAQGWYVVLVSSGAIAAGREVLGYPELPRFIPKKQMLAAVGQPRLMAMYEQFFAIYDLPAAQVLLTRADLTDRRRYLNARNTFEALLMQKVTPIVNENDTVATDEIRFGDNDNLSAQVASMIEADVLVLLTDQEGLYTSDPRQNSGAELIGEVEGGEIPGWMWEAAGGSNNGLGTGGMVTKLHAADIARRTGTKVYIARGGEAEVVVRIAAGEAIGTYFAPVLNKLEGRKRFLLAGERSSGLLTVDGGAVRALRRGGSLLPVGVSEVTGDFERGDTVRVADTDGKILALGLSNYSSRDLITFRGMQSGQIEPLLGYTFGDEVIHRNHMILL
jgi:glutamate 5-kinase